VKPIPPCSCTVSWAVRITASAQTLAAIAAGSAAAAGSASKATAA
jgi:hypothetical protein